MGPHFLDHYIATLTLVYRWLLLELMIPPLTGWVVQWENALLELGMSWVRSPVCPFLFSSYSFGIHRIIK